MAIREVYEMLEISEAIKGTDYFSILACNLRKYRMKFYHQYENLNKKVDNPYSSENIASLLNISRRHYNRLENPHYLKNISLDKLLILREIYDISLDDFFKK